MFSKPTINTILDDLEKDYVMHKRKSARHLTSRMKSLRTALGKHKAEGMRGGTLAFYVTIRQQQGVSNATLNRELAALKRAYTLAEISPPPIPTLKEENVRQGTFTHEEIDRVCAELPEYLRPLVRFAYLTGRRKGELLAIQWKDIDIKNQVIHIRQSTTKNGLPDTIPLTKEMYTILYHADLESDHEYSDYGMSNTCPYVFCHGSRPISDFSRTWRRACTRAGLPGKLFHDIRRTVATDLIRAGVPEKEAMSVTGHKTRSTFERYHIVSAEETRKAQQKLSDYRRDSQ